MRPLELYLHIPFCIRKCHYCDFLSAPSTKKERQEYVESLCRQIRSYRKLAEAYHVVSIFVGGGTPSVLESEQICRIFDAVYDTFLVDIDAEITLEANPGTVTREKLKSYCQAGINRISIGLQSADNEELRMLGRIHTYEEFMETYRLVRQEGYGNLNIDLMSAIPGQTVESWEKTLRTVAELEPEHISAYSLIMEEGTPFYERYGAGEHAEELPDEEEERQMYHLTNSVLAEYGYHRYEISNYAKPGYECRHNLGYWDRTEYLGIGAGAASLIGNCRWKQKNAFSKQSRIEEYEKLSIQSQMEEYMFLGLRKTEGVSSGQFGELFGCSMSSVYGDVLKKMYTEGLMERAGDYVRLTEKGLDISNYVMSEFLL